MKRFSKYVIALLLVLTVTVSSVISVGAVNIVSNKINFEPKSDSLYLLNLDTDTVVYNNNSAEKRYPASLTKIMTYIIVAEQVEDLENTKVTIKKDLLDTLNGTDSSLSGLSKYIDKELTVMQLLYCLMVSSGNDAALVLADYVGNGDVQSFVDLMNNKAKELGCENTNFINPHGLHDENHYTTAEDLAKIVKYALTVKYFTEVTNTVKYYINGDEKEPLVNTNKMINPDEKDYYYEFARGIKTGTTDEAGYCLVSAALNNGVTYLCIALHAPCYDDNGEDMSNGAMTDSKKLYEWAYSNIELKTVLGDQTRVCETKLNYASNQDTITLVPEYSYSTMVPKDFKESDLEIKSQCPEEVDAPVTRGDVIGTATISYNGEELTKVNLVAGETVERSEFAYAMTVIKNVVSTPVFMICACIVLVLFIAYLVFLQRLSKKKKDRDVKKYREM